MRRAVSPAAVLAVAAMSVTGCTSPPGSDAARAAAESFNEALSASNADAACGWLAPETLSELEDSVGEPCSEALLDEDVEPGGVERVAVYGQSAFVQTATSALFLGRFPDGWRVTAAGCEPRPDLPYDCAVEGG
jgi:hypothetical protein